jgi:hypothetical protein
MGLGLDLDGRPLLLVHDGGFSRVLRYDSAGDLIQSAVTPVPFFARDLAVDPSGDIYLLGEGVLKLGSGGAWLWPEPRDLHRPTLDSGGFLHAVDGSGDLVKVDPAGDDVWRLGGMGRITSIALDPSGTVFAASDAAGADARSVHVLSEIDPGGDLVAQADFELAVCCGEPAIHASGGELVAAVGSGSTFSIVRLRSSGRRDFLRGDANEDGAIGMADAIGVLSWLFLGGEEPACRDAADTNDDGRIGITDPIYLLRHLFQGGFPPPPPFPVAGSDRTPDALGCSG